MVQAQEGTSWRMEVTAGGSGLSQSFESCQSGLHISQQRVLKEAASGQKSRLGSRALRH